jgi:hypothetical protein
MQYFSLAITFDLLDRAISEKGEDPALSEKKTIEMGCLSRVDIEKKDRYLRVCAKKKKLRKHLPTLLNGDTHKRIYKHRELDSNQRPPDPRERVLGS